MIGYRKLNACRWPPLKHYGKRMPVLAIILANRLARLSKRINWKGRWTTFPRTAIPFFIFLKSDLPPRLVMEQPLQQGPAYRLSAIFAQPILRMVGRAHRLFR